MPMNGGTVVSYMMMDMTHFRKGVLEAQTAYKTIAAQGTAAGAKLATFGGAAVSAGKTLTVGLTLPVVAAGAVVTKMGSDFQKTMSKVQAITVASADDMKKLEKQARDLGASTAFSAKQVGEGMTYLGMAGFKTNEILEAMPGLLDLAAASETDLATTSDIVSDALTAFGLKAKDTGHLADIMAKASSTANTNVVMLGESYKYAAPVAAAFNMSAEETTAALAFMANSGIKASQAGTTLRTALTNLAKPTDEMKLKMQELGIVTTDAQGNMLPFNDIMGQVRTSFEGLTQEQQLNAASTLFGKRALSGMLAVLNTSTEDFAKYTKTLEDADGASKQMAETMLDNLHGTWVKIKSAFEGWMITLSKHLIPMLMTLAEKVQAALDWFNGLSDGTQELIVKIGVFLAVLGPLLLIFGKLILLVQTVVSVGSSLFAVFGAAGTAFAAAGGGVTGLTAALVTMLGPVGATVLGIGALIAIGYKLYKNWDNIKYFMVNIFYAINIAAYKMQLSILNIVDKVAKYIPGLKDEVTKLKAEIEDSIADQEYSKKLNAIKSGQADVNQTMADARMAMSEKRMEEAEGIPVTEEATDALFDLDSILGDTTDGVNDLANSQAQLAANTKEATDAIKEQQNAANQVVKSTRTGKDGKKHTSYMRYDEQSGKTLLNKDGVTYVFDKDGSKTEIAAPTDEEIRQKAIETGKDMSVAAAMLNSERLNDALKYHDGGWVKGFGKREVPAILEAGEYVVDRKTAQGGLIDYKALAAAIAQQIKPSIEYKPTFNSPKALGTDEVRQQLELQAQQLALGVNF